MARRFNADWEQVCALVGEDRSYWRTGRQGKWKAKYLPTWSDGEVRTDEAPRPVRFKYWMEGAPEWLDLPRDIKGDTRDTRSAFSWDLRFGHDVLVGWTHLLTVPREEAECPFCGPGSGWDGSAEQVTAQLRQQVSTCTGYRGDPKCRICEGSGYVYGGTAALVVYRRTSAHIKDQED